MTVNANEITPAPELPEGVKAPETVETTPTEVSSTPAQVTKPPAEAVPVEPPVETPPAVPVEATEQVPAQDVAGELAKANEALGITEKRRADTQSAFQKKSEELKVSERRSVALQKSNDETLKQAQAEFKERENELNTRVKKLEEEGSSLSQTELVRETTKINELAMDQAEARRETKSLMREVQRDCETSYSNYIRDNEVAKETTDRVGTLLNEIETSPVPHYAMTELAMLALAGEQLMNNLPLRDEQVKADAIKQARELVRADTPSSGAQPAEAKPENEEAPIINNQAMAPGEWSMWQQKRANQGITSGFVPIEKRR